MITENLANLLKQIMMALLILLPDYQPPPAADISAFSIIGWLVPINEIVLLATFIGLYASASLVYALVNFVINKVRGSG